MAVNEQTVITAANYNGLQARVSNLLGAGFDQIGYGQTPKSAPVRADIDKISHEDMNLLREDINTIAVHQTGSITTIEALQPGETIAANTVNGNANKGFNSYINAVTILESGTDTTDATQTALESFTQSTRYSAWNGSISHIFTIQFDSVDHRRAFFNAGGEIHFSASVESGSSAKGSDWSDMLSNMGTIKFKKTTTEVTGSGGNNGGYGNFSLDAGYNTIFDRFGNALPYQENSYKIEGKGAPTERNVQFRITFSDADQGDPNEDENVFGITNSTIQIRRPVGSIVVEAPNFSTQRNLADGAQ